MIQKIKAWWRQLHEKSLFDKKEKRFYYVGDVAPDSLLNRKPTDGPLGAFIVINPETKVIERIWTP